MAKPALCIHQYCPMCNEEQDYTLQKELTNVYVYECDHCEWNQILISKGVK